MIKFLRINYFLTWKTRIFFVLQAVILIFISWLIINDLINMYYSYYNYKKIDIEEGYYICGAVETNDCKKIQDAVSKYEDIYMEEGIEKILYTFRLIGTIDFGNGNKVSEMNVYSCSDDYISSVEYDMREGRWFNNEVDNQVVLGSAWKDYCNVGDIITLTVAKDYMDEFEVVGFLSLDYHLGIGYSHLPDWQAISNGDIYTILINDKGRFLNEWSNIEDFYSEDNIIVETRGDSSFVDECANREYVCSIENIHNETEKMFRRALVDRIPYLFIYLSVVIFAMIGTNYAVIPQFLSAMYIYYLSGMAQKEYKKMLLKQQLFDGVIIFAIEMLVMCGLLEYPGDRIIEKTLVCLVVIVISILVFFVQIGSISKIHPMEVYRRYIAT